VKALTVTLGEGEWRASHYGRFKFWSRAETKLSGWKTVWAAGLAWWPNFYLTRVGLKLFSTFCVVNYVNYLFIVTYNIA